ncbi:MAG: hypothetical protein NTW17_03575 [Candidatus Pacearchaeota archaeon]|nr:hypothetical protein [Candidatus Pacearchaeota archaeon]
MAEKGGNELGVAGFTLGIISLTVLFFSPLYGIFAAIIGLIFSAVQQKKHKTRLGRWGVVLNTIGLIANAVFFYIYIKYVIDYLQGLQSLDTSSFPTA